jgi:hypothetical protein
LQPAPSRLVLAYVGAAHLALLSAAGTAVASAPALAATWLHPHTLATVHLVTLGWLTATAFGAVYAVLPLALRTPMPARWPDVVACALVLAGASGVSSHMALATYSGVAWSGGAVAAGAAWVGLRAGSMLGAGRAPRRQRLTIVLAFTALVAAALLGVLVAIDRQRPLLAGGHLRALAGHAHLALAGWLGLLTVGIGHRLLPMLLPASPLPESRAWQSTACLGAGALALPAVLVLTPGHGPASALAAALLGAGVVLFARDVLELRRRRKPKAPGLPRRDPALVAIAAAVACLVAATALGLALLLGELPHGIASLYGVLLLVGGFGGLVLGVGLRLWPLFAWLRSFARRGVVPGLAPPSLPSLRLQWTAVVAWLAAVAGLGAGAGLGDPLPMRLGAIAWLLAAAATSANLWLVFWRARRADWRH